MINGYLHKYVMIRVDGILVEGFVLDITNDFIKLIDTGNEEILITKNNVSMIKKRSVEKQKSEVPVNQQVAVVRTPVSQVPDPNRSIYMDLDGQQENPYSTPFIKK